MAGNGWLAYSPALHLLRESGTTIGLLDLLDERKLRPGEAAVLAGLLNLFWTSPCMQVLTMAPSPRPTGARGAAARRRGRGAA